MKKLTISGGVAAILAAGLMASCQQDVDVTKFSQRLEHDQTFYVNIDVKGSQEVSRALIDNPMDNYDEDYDPTEEPDFNKGEGDENTITTIYFIFYDENGDRVATTQVRADRAQDGSNSSMMQSGSINSIHKGIVQIDVKHGSLPPAYVMAFINPITSTNFEINPNFATLDVLKKTTRPKIIDDEGKFAMSKSVYYGTNRVSGKEHDLIVATPLVNKEKADERYPQNIFPTRPEAESALNAESGIVDIYVERYAVKVNFALEDDAKNAEIDLGEGIKKLTFVPEYWAVNAYESDTYITKSFLKADEKGEFTGEELSFQDLNEAFGSLENGGQPRWYWNSEEHHRCYWAQSPAYYSAAYPRVADDILDKTTLGGAAGGYALGYYTYNDLVQNATGEINAKARDLNNPSDVKTAIYARENTVAGSALQAAAANPLASPKAAIPSVLLVGHYNLEGEDLAQSGKTIYIQGNATNGYTLYETEEAMLNYFMRTTIQFLGQDHTQIFNYNKWEFTQPDYKKYFTIIHPGLDARGDLVVDSRHVTIQLNVENLDPEGNNPLYALIDGEYVQVTNDNIAEVNKQMFYAAGTAQGYQGGKVYYTIPIKHLGYYRSNNPNRDKNANAKDFNWSAVLSGDFGLVRNHVYSIIVDKIEGLGNGIPNPDDPIVPPTDPEEYFIGARLIVLNWAVLPTQHETL